MNGDRGQPSSQRGGFVGGVPDTHTHAHAQPRTRCARGRRRLRTVNAACWRLLGLPVSAEHVRSATGGLMERAWRRRRRRHGRSGLLLLRWLVLGGVLAAGERGRGAARRKLHAGVELVGEVLPLGSPGGGGGGGAETTLFEHGVREYELVGMEPARTYEVRVSYPATIPAAFTLRVVVPSTATPRLVLSGEDEPELRRSRRRRRRLGARRALLDTEKVVFGARDAGAQPVVRVSAALRGVAPPGHPSHTHVTYNIMLEECVLGVLPKSALPVAAHALALLALALGCAAFAAPFYRPRPSYGASART
eukprot:scaffold172_cov355-Prasinococcus_capsulatus_cf.AAC.8